MDFRQKAKDAKDALKARMAKQNEDQQPEAQGGIQMAPQGQPIQQQPQFGQPVMQGQPVIAQGQPIAYQQQPGMGGPPPQQQMYAQQQPGMGGPPPQQPMYAQQQQPMYAQQQQPVQGGGVVYQQQQPIPQNFEGQRQNQATQKAREPRKKDCCSKALTDCCPCCEWNIPYLCCGIYREGPDGDLNAERPEYQDWVCWCYPIRTPPPFANQDTDGLINLTCWCFPVWWATRCIFAVYCFLCLTTLIEGNVIGSDLILQGTDLEQSGQVDTANSMASAMGDDTTAEELQAAGSLYMALNYVIFIIPLVGICWFLNYFCSQQASKDKTAGKRRRLVYAMNNMMIYTILVILVHVYIMTSVFGPAGLSVSLEVVIYNIVAFLFFYWWRMNIVRYYRDWGTSSYIPTAATDQVAKKKRMLPYIFGGDKK